MFPLRRRLQRLALRRGGGGACLACFARPLVDRSQRVVDKPANRKLALKSRLPTAQNKTSCRAMGCDSIQNKYLVQFLCTVSLTLSERSPAMLVLIPLYHGNDDIKTQRRPVLIIRRLSPPSSPIFFGSLPTPSSPDSCAGPVDTKLVQDAGLIHRPRLAFRPPGCYFRKKRHQNTRRSHVTAPADLGFGSGPGSGWSGPTCKVQIDDTRPGQSFGPTSPAHGGSLLYPLCPLQTDLRPTHLRLEGARPLALQDRPRYQRSCRQGCCCCCRCRCCRHGPPTPCHPPTPPLPSSLLLLARLLLLGGRGFATAIQYDGVRCRESGVATSGER